MQNEPVEVTLKVTNVFENLGVPYLIGGSLASTLYGMVRTTQDSDIVAEMHREHLPQFVVALGEEFYLDDFAYLLAWARELEVSDLLERALQETDLGTDKR
jgi:hypothetical protein